MRNVRMIRLDAATEQALENHPKYTDALATSNWGQRADVVRVIVGQVRDEFPAADGELHWGGYLVADVATERFVGSCALKAQPTEEGVVDFTYPDDEGQGYTTAMAAKLMAMGSSSPDVTRIIAYTLPQNSGSTRVLEKNGMRRVGEMNDPEDGPVWRWEYLPG